jgi:hypothetical protein
MLPRGKSQKEKIEEQELEDVKDERPGLKRTALAVR